MHSGSQLTCSELCSQNKSSQWPLGGPFIESAHDLHEPTSQQDDDAGLRQVRAGDLDDGPPRGFLAGAIMGVWVVLRLNWACEIPLSRGEGLS